MKDDTPDATFELNGKKKKQRGRRSNPKLLNVEDLRRRGTSGKKERSPLANKKSWG